MSKQQAKTVLDFVDQRYAVEWGEPPKDYATDSYESKIIDNADIIESYYLKYAEKSKLAPEQCKKYLAQDLGMKLIELMEREA